MTAQLFPVVFSTLRGSRGNCLGQECYHSPLDTSLEPGWLLAKHSGFESSV